MARDDPHFRLRLPSELKRMIEQSATSAGRSLNAEIVLRLNESFMDDEVAKANGFGSFQDFGQKAREVMESAIKNEEKISRALETATNLTRVLDELPDVKAVVLKKLREEKKG